MGYLGVQTVVKAIKGEKDLPKKIDTGATLVTKANLNTPRDKKIAQSLTMSLAIKKND